MATPATARIWPAPPQHPPAAAAYAHLPSPVLTSAALPSHYSGGRSAREAGPRSPEHRGLQLGDT
eukprot:scaffold45580_cov24-Phaeocystis_antarctica.AAC.1